MKNKLALLFTLIFISIYSQKTEISKEEKDFIYSMKFEMTKELFKKPEYSYKNKKLDTNKIFIKSNKSKASIISSIEYLEKNSKLELKNERTKKIILSSKFPESFTPEPFTVISIEIKENHLYGDNNTLLETLNAESTSINGINIIHSNQLNFDAQFNESLNGKILYNVRFITDYSTKKIAKKDIGNSFKLGKIEYKIIDIFENKIILKSNLDNKLTIDDIKLKCINLDKKEENELVSEALNSSTSLIDEKIFKLFKEDNNLNLETFKTNISYDNLMSENLADKFIVLETSAPIENEMILYEPIYGVNKTIEVKL